MAGFDYVGVPWPADAADPQPELRAELEAAGFTLVGGIAVAGSAARDIDRMARSYAPGRDQEFAHWSRQPAQVFAAPDRSAFAKLSWLWDCRYGVIATVLPDGEVIETMTDWEADPVWPRALAPHYARTTDRRSEQQVLATDLGVEVVDGGAGDAWAAHERRLAQVGCDLPDHSTLDDFVRLFAAQSAARSAWTGRVKLVTGAVALLLAFAAYALLALVIPSSSWWLTVAAVAVAALMCLFVNTRLFLRVRHWRRLRPKFRAPVPGAGRRAGRPTA